MSEELTPGVERLFNFSITENPGLFTKRQSRQHQADRTIYNPDEKIVFRIRDSGFMYSRNSYLKFQLKLGRLTVPGDSTSFVFDGDVVLSNNVNTDYNLRGNNIGAGNSAAGSVFKRVIVSVGSFNITDEDFAHHRIDKTSKYACDLDAGVTTMVSEGFYEGAPIFYNAPTLSADVNSRFSALILGPPNEDFFDRTVCIPLYKIAGFFETDRLIPLDFFKEAFRLEILLQPRLRAVVRRAGPADLNMTYQIEDPELFLDIYDPSPEIMGEIIKQEKTNGLIIPYTSYIGREFSNSNGANKIFLPFNDSVERAIAVYTVPVSNLLQDSVVAEFLQTTTGTLISYQVRVNKKRIPANGPITSDSQMYSHTMNSLNRLGDCKFGPLINFREANRDFPNLPTYKFYVTDLTRGVFGSDGSNAIILRPGDLEVEIELDLSADPTTYYVYLEHMKVLKLINGSLMDAE